MKHKNHLKNGALLSYVETVSRIVVNLIYVPILLKYIGQSEYGVYQLSASIMAYLTVMESSLSAGTLRFYCKYKAKGEQEKTENVLAHARIINAIVAGIIVLLTIIATFIIDPIYRASLSTHELYEVKTILLIFAFSSALNLLGYVYYAIINGNEKFEFLKLLNITAILIQPVAVLMVIRHRPTAIFVVFVQVLINVVVFFMRRYYALHVVKEKIHYHSWNKKIFKGIFGFTASVFLVALADQIFWKADQLILARLYDVNVVAVYAVGAQIYNIYMNIGTAITSVFFPRISEHVEKGEHTEINNLFIKVGRLTWIVLGLILSGFFLFGKEFLNLWVGSTYEPAYYVALIIMIPFTVDLVQSLGLIILQAYNKYMFRAKMYFTIAVLNIGLTIFLARKYGMIGAAIATAVSITIGTGFIMNWYFAKHIHLNVRNFWQELGKVALWGSIPLICGIGMQYLPFSEGWLSFIIECVIYTVIYGSVMIKFAMNDWERSLIPSFKK